MKQLILLVALWAITSIAGTDLMAKTQSKDYNPIEWKNKENPENGLRSLLPISGYIENGIITIYLYESPTEATVRIQGESGSIVYDSVYADPSTIVIDLADNANRVYQITVEYEENAFIGTFEI